LALSIYHRLESPTQTPADSRAQQTSGELWGRPSRFSTIAKVKAYEGPLPRGDRGIEFSTDVAPDPGCPPGQAFWSASNPGVRVGGDVVKLHVTITKVRQ
jgi:hypothetical protein